jgi:hypothetical protein
VLDDRLISLCSFALAVGFGSVALVLTVVVLIALVLG